MSVHLFQFKDAIRVHAKKFEGISDPELRKFSVDPQITTFQMLQHILSKAFDIETGFDIIYANFNRTTNQERFEAISCDSDLQTAFQRTFNKTAETGNEPCLHLILKLTNNDSNGSLISRFKDMAPTKFLSSTLLIGTIEKTLTKVQKALSFGDEQSFVENPVTYLEFKKFLNPIGQLNNFDVLRKHIFYRGVEPSLRKVLWRHLLNVYPDGMTGEQRLTYIRRKSNEYYELRDEWLNPLNSNIYDNDLISMTKMIQKDVLRTDRYHKFYEGNDNNQNLTSLFNILTTFSLNHPKTGYCQGMNDFASALLVTMENEALAYVCFCALMKRIYKNFTADDIAMTQKFSHLIDALSFYDPEFCNYIKDNHADGLLFCYRWILLEMKREFAFNDSLFMFEILWSSLPFKSNTKELELFEKKFKIRLNFKSSLNDIAISNHFDNESLKNRIQASLSYNNFLLLEKKKERLALMNLKGFQSCDNFDKKLIKSLNEFYQLQKSPTIPTSVTAPTSPIEEEIPQAFMWQWPSQTSNQNQLLSNNVHEDKGVSTLPPPNQFGGGNPFLMFLCLTMLLQNRDTIMQQQMDHNEMAMFFDKLVRKNNVHKVLNQARLMFVEYLEQFHDY